MENFTLFYSNEEDALLSCKFFEIFLCIFVIFKDWLSLVLIYPLKFRKKLEFWAKLHAKFFLIYRMTGKFFFINCWFINFWKSTKSINCCNIALDFCINNEINYIILILFLLVFYLLFN